MKKDLTELVFIIDKSGSMSGLESDTIGGFNSLIDKQKKEQGEAIVTTVFFNDRREVIHNRANIDNIAPLAINDYCPSGMTALLDAVGNTLKDVIRDRKLMKKEEQPESTIVVITTDGLENASVEYTYEKVKGIIECQQNDYNWEFIFLGANIDVIREGSKMGIRKERSVNYDCSKEELGNVYCCLSNAISNKRSKKSVDFDKLIKFGRVIENID
jgi:hypothetical protein